MGIPLTWLHRITNYPRPEWGRVKGRSRVREREREKEREKERERDRASERGGHREGKVRGMGRGREGQRQLELWGLGSARLKGFGFGYKLGH